jgi:hypothetical protein
MSFVLRGMVLFNYLVNRRVSFQSLKAWIAVAVLEESEERSLSVGQAEERPEAPESGYAENYDEGHSGQAA